MRHAESSAILSAVREARRALAAPGLASIARAQDSLAIAEAGLRLAVERSPDSLASHDWDGLRRELSMLQEFAGGIQEFFAAALGPEPLSAAAGRIDATGACVSWSG